MKFLLVLLVSGCTGQVVLGSRPDVALVDLSCSGCDFAEVKDLTTQGLDLARHVDLTVVSDLSSDDF